MRDKLSIFRKWSIFYGRSKIVKMIYFCGRKEYEIATNKQTRLSVSRAIQLLQYQLQADEITNKKKYHDLITASTLVHVTQLFSFSTQTNRIWEINRAYLYLKHMIFVEITLAWKIESTYTSPLEFMLLWEYLLLTGRWMTVIWEWKYRKIKENIQYPFHSCYTSSVLKIIFIEFNWKNKLFLLHIINFKNNIYWVQLRK